MNILKRIIFRVPILCGYESDIYDNPSEQLTAMRSYDVEWQKHRCDVRFHMTKKRGSFTSDEFFKIVRDIKELIGAKYGYEGVELYPMSGACTTQACKAHSILARKAKPIMAQDVNEFFSCEVRVDLPKEEIVEPTNFVWITTEGKGKRIKVQMALNRDKGDLIIDRYFVKNKVYNLGDGFL